MLSCSRYRLCSVRRARGPLSRPRSPGPGGGAGGEGTAAGLEVHRTTVVSLRDAAGEARRLIRSAAP